MFWSIFLLVSAVKLLCIPLYHSTDFEVHRNWLAITHSLPISRWYYENTSEWTLDYPPIFAYFEYYLSQIAQFFDPQMLVVDNLNYASERTVLFQRLSVIVTDIVYAYGAQSCADIVTDAHSPKLRMLLTGITLGNIGLFFVDHIHFQYNGLLFGILLISIAKIQREKFLQAAFYFALLLNMKHIFIYVAPAFIVYLFRFYCLRLSNPFFGLMKLGLVVGSVTLVSFGPFYNQLPQVISRLFPFKRGLCHAYWAPNFWALYNAADLAVSKILSPARIATYTGGLVQEFRHLSLPSILPVMTFFLTAVTMVPCLAKLYALSYNRKESPKHLIRTIVLCAATSFMFGWHVHEKAILMVLVPLTLLSLNDEYQASSIIFLSIVGNFSLMPLLYTPELFLPKIILFACYEVFLIAGLVWHYRTLRMHLIKSLYLLGFVGVLVYEPFVQHWLGLADRYSFLPLMLVSCYSALGVVYFWFTYYRTFLSIRSDIEEPVAELPKTKKLQKKSAASKKSEGKKTN